MLGNLVWALGRPPISTQCQLVVTTMPGQIEDATLIERVSRAYRQSSAQHSGTESFWNGFTLDFKQDIHLALTGKDTTLAEAVLRRPDQNAHFWGFDAVCKAPDGKVEPHELVFRNLNDASDWKVSYALWLHSALINLAEAVGASRTMYPETEPGLHYAAYGEPSNLDAVLDQIESVIGLPIDFPNPFPGELGLNTSRGVAGFRAIQAIYQAWRIVQLLKNRPNARVIEIGAGLGRTAYYAHRFGVRDYTIIDIPMTGAAQGYFLGRTLDNSTVALMGETAFNTDIKVLPPESLPMLIGRYDLVVNVDSFTELDNSTMLTYWNFSKHNADLLLSINHEFNPRPFREIYKADAQLSFTRYPYWMRRGYVEELITFKKSEIRRC